MLLEFLGGTSVFLLVLFFLTRIVLCHSRLHCTQVVKHINGEMNSNQDAELFICALVVYREVKFFLHGSSL